MRSSSFDLSDLLPSDTSKDARYEVSDNQSYFPAYRTVSHALSEPGPIVYEDECSNLPCDPISPISIPTTVASMEDAQETTVILRNISRKYVPSRLREDIDKAGFHNQYDFLFLRMDSSCKTNFGYAFINFKHVETAMKFIATYDGKFLLRYPSKKPLRVSYARYQGLASNVSALLSTPGIYRLPKDCKPVLVLNDGQVEPFPLSPAEISDDSSYFLQD